MFTLLGVPCLGFPAPFIPILILWVNLDMDGPPAMTPGVGVLFLQVPVLREARKSSGARIRGKGRWRTPAWLSLTGRCSTHRLGAGFRSRVHRNDFLEIHLK